MTLTPALGLPSLSVTLPRMIFSNSTTKTVDLSGNLPYICYKEEEYDAN